MAEIDCELFEALGSLAVSEIVCTPTTFELADTVCVWLAPVTRLPDEGVGVPSVALPLIKAAEKV
jgi:hypothetical protein